MIFNHESTKARYNIISGEMLHKAKREGDVHDGKSVYQDRMD